MPIPQGLVGTIWGEVPQCCGMSPQPVRYVSGGTKVVELCRTMRTTLLASVFALSLVACAGQIDGGTGGDDVPEDCGNDVTDPGETCDDGNDVSGDGCSATCQTEIAPSLRSSVDKASVSLDLGKTDTLTLTLTSEGGYTGSVLVTPSVVDGANVVIPGVTLTGPQTVAVAANATVPAVFTLTVPPNATGQAITGSLKFDLSVPGLAAQNLTSTLSLSNIYTVTYTTTTTDSPVTHPIESGVQSRNVSVKRGTVIRFKNDSTIRHVTHGGGTFAHEDIAAGGQPGATYEQNTIGSGPGSTGTLGCHDHGSQNDAGYVQFTIE